MNILRQHSYFESSQSPGVVCTCLHMFAHVCACLHMFALASRGVAGWQHVDAVLAVFRETGSIRIAAQNKLCAMMIHVPGMSFFIRFARFHIIS